MSKARIIKLLKVLQEETDYNHPLNSEQLITKLDEQNEVVERKTIYDDIKVLNECGYAIEMMREGELNGYYYDSPIFESSELRVLIDAVNAGNFLTTKKTNEMIEKLLSLTNKFERKMFSETSGYRHNKTKNEHILYNIDALQKAIFTKQAITFSYFSYNIKNEKKLRKKSQYMLVPYALVWNQERYYLIGYDERYEAFAHYRLDRMENVETIQTEHVRKHFDLQEYMEKTFEMYAGDDVRVRLRCATKLASEINDQFGENKIVLVDSEDHFVTDVRVKNTLTFYSWVFKFGDAIEILAPEEIRKEYRDTCMSVVARYDK